MTQTVFLGPEPNDAAVAEAVSAAAEVLEAGGSVILPTDTVYGVAALPTVPGATAAVAELKGRSDRQPMAVLVADVAQARSLVADGAVTAEVQRWMDELWPGALTLVLPRSPAAAAMELGGRSDTVGIRCPDHAFLRALCRRVGPLATTSANRHGEPTPSTAGEASASLGVAVGLVVDGGPAGAVASTVVDVTTVPWVVLRSGAIEEAALSRGRAGPSGTG